METTIKFKVIKNDGKKKSIKVKYKDCPDFTEETKVANFAKHPTKEGYVQVTFGDNVEALIGDVEHLNIVTKIEDQIDEWVESFDKLLWMDDNDVMVILTWEVVSYVGKQIDRGESELTIVNSTSKEVVLNPKVSDIDNMKLFFEFNKEEISQDVIDNYIVIYSEMADNLKHLNWKKQMDIVFKTMSIATTSARKALDDLDRYREALRSIDWNKHKYTKAEDINKYGTWDLEAIGREAKMIQNGHILDPNLLIDNV